MISDAVDSSLKDRLSSGLMDFNTLVFELQDIEVNRSLFEFVAAELKEPANSDVVVKRVEELAPDVARQLWDEVLARQPANDVITDNDRLRKVYRSLGRKIVGFDNEWDCRQCGVDDITRRFRAGEFGRAFGYVFYHDQTVENVKASGVMRLYYSSFSEKMDDAKDIKVGKKLVAALRKEGFDVRWSGSPDDAVEIHNFNWSARLLPLPKIT